MVSPPPPNPPPPRPALLVCLCFRSDQEKKKKKKKKTPPPPTFPPAQVGLAGVFTLPTNQKKKKKKKKKKKSNWYSPENRSNTLKSDWKNTPVSAYVTGGMCWSRPELVYFLDKLSAEQRTGRTSSKPPQRQIAVYMKYVVRWRPFCVHSFLCFVSQSVSHFHFLLFCLRSPFYHDFSTSQTA